MTFLPYIVDIVVLAVLLFFTRRGRKLGLIKTLSSVLSIILAFSCASFLTKEAAPYVSEKYVSPYISDAIMPKAQQLEQTNKDSDPAAVGDMFRGIGVSDSIISDAISDFTNAITKSVLEPITVMTNSVAFKITYTILFLVFFLLSLLILRLLFKLLNLTSKLPGINFLNKTLGLIFGLVLGYFSIVILSFIMLKFGIVLTDKIINETTLLSFVIQKFPFSIMA